MNNKTSIVTGANAGIGLETSIQLAKKDCRVIMVCRSEEKAKTARDQVVKRSGNERVTYEIADLASQNEIRELSKRITESNDKIDILINNAGLVKSKFEHTEDRLETVLAVNHIAPFLLTHLMIPMLRRSDDGRIVNVSSNNHFKARMKFYDIHHKKNFSGLKAYGQSKLANVLFTYELNRKLRDADLDQISVNALDPGLINTNIGNKNAGWIYSMAWHLRKRQGVSPAEGAKTQVYLATAEELKGVSGKYWRRSKPVPSSEASYNIQHAQQLWQMSKNMCNIENYLN